MLASLPERVTISGHTDNVPISTAQYPSNWELSSARAVSLMRGVMAVQPSLNPARFSALGYSEYRPIASNDTEEGRAQNRRVEVFIARSMKLSGNTASDAGTGAVQAGGTSAAEPSASSASSPAPDEGVYKLSTDMRPAPQQPGVVPAPLQH